MRRSYKVVALIIFAVVIFDQITKVLALEGINPYNPIEIIPGFFNLVLVMNPGAAFGIFNDGGMLRTIFLISTSVLALILIGVFIRQSTDKVTEVALSLIAGGAIGNLIDRVRFGEVVDFLDIYPGGYFNNWHWPAFNIADSAITIGVVLAIVGLYLAEEPKKEDED
ncbi:MAG: signal peptidase II [Deltaproteobacteria bacterium]|nr:signal peptidase II [Deltaproteobacteria bacterium]